MVKKRSPIKQSKIKNHNSHNNPNSPNNHNRSHKKKIKLGLALGAGGARGFTHIGVLKELHKHNIYPDYIAGTSIGAAIGALYAAGHSPEEIEEIANSTDLINMLDFTIPKRGLIKGKLAEKRIEEYVFNKKFKDLNIPLRIVSYNFTRYEKVVFKKGNVAKAVRASIAIPGIVSPLRMDGHDYIDGAVANPTPFDVVREMGADVIIAVDLYHKDKIVESPIVTKSSFFTEMREKFIMAELLYIKNYLFPEKWPKVIRRLLKWVFDKILYPARIARIITGRELPTITKVLYDSVTILTNNLASERLKYAKIDFLLNPKFGKLGWTSFDSIDSFVKIGEKSMNQHIPELKKRLKLF